MRAFHVGGTGPQLSSPHSSLSGRLFAPFCNKALLLLLLPQWVRIGGTGKQELF